MATVAPAPVDAQPHENGASHSVQPDDQSHPASQVNGFATMHNSLPEEDTMAVDSGTATSTAVEPPSSGPSALLKAVEGSTQPSVFENSASNQASVPIVGDDSIQEDPPELPEPPTLDTDGHSQALLSNNTPDDPQQTANGQPDMDSDIKPDSIAAQSNPTVEPSSSDVPPAPVPAVESEIESTSKPEPTSDMPAQTTTSDISPAEQNADETVTSIKVAREREDDEHDDGPSTKRAKTTEATQEDAPAPPQAEIPAEQSGTHDSEAAVTQPEAQPSTDTQPMSPSQITSIEDYGPMTEIQLKRLLEGMRNLKKGKHAGHFAKPVDPVALNLPNYYNVVKIPMDLSTMEQKLKDNKYGSVSEYTGDFDQMVQNAITFNGQQHAVAQAGMMLRSQLNAQLKKVPKPGDPVPPEANQKAKRTSLPHPPRDTQRRESRQSTGAAAASPVTPFAPDPNGVPLTRRDSVVDRPKRKIQRPAPRDLQYPKPQKKKYKAELKFAEEVLTEMERPRYQAISAAFMHPVDPVALNIPNYHQVIKKPMDVSTVRQKLTDQQYENLKEFEQDWRLMFKNCYKFNPATHPVNQAGHQYEEVFNQEMSKKNERIKALAPPSARESSQEASDEDDDEDEEEDEETEQQKKLRQLNEQLALLSEQASKLMQEGAAGSGKKGKTKEKKGKAGKAEGGKKKKTSGVGASAARPEKKPKAKPAKTKAKPLSQKEKEEISNRIFELPTEEINSVADQIKKSMRDRGMPVGDEQEMEFNIDDIPEEILRNILTRLRRNTQGPIAKVDDDEYESPARTFAPKGKRNKPMSRQDTASQMAAIQQQIETFTGNADSPPANAQMESSDDDESGSESEEE